MNTRRMTARKVEEGRMNQKIRPQFEQLLQDGQGVQSAQISPEGVKVPIKGQGNEVSVVPQK